jgi:hypothetical protein
MADESRDNQSKRRLSETRVGNGLGLDGETRKHIGRMLKATYDEVAHEPVPDKFLDLLKQLEASDLRKR